jgi:hypothetical protein
MHGIQRLDRKPIHIGSSKEEGVGALNKFDFDLEPRQVPVNTTVITSRPITDRNSTAKTKKKTLLENSAPWSQFCLLHHFPQIRYLCPFLFLSLQEHIAQLIVQSYVNSSNMFRAANQIVPYITSAHTCS